MPDGWWLLVVAGALTALYAVLHEAVVFILDWLEARDLAAHDAAVLSNDVPDGASTESITNHPFHR